LVGRTHELADLTEKLHHPAYRCVTVVGPGGIGKTRLAVAAGAQLRTEFPDGVWLVELGGLAPTTPAEPPAQVHDRLAAAIGQSLRLVFYGATPLAEQIANQLAGKSALLILDSFEHLVAGAAWLPTLLAAAPHLRLLVTTRHRLPLQSQLTYLLEGLSVPPAAACRCPWIRQRWPRWGRSVVLSKGRRGRLNWRWQCSTSRRRRRF
jgi:predicted ATPase